MSGLPEGHVIGSGTVLDTGRLQQMLGAHVKVTRAMSRPMSWASAATASLSLGPALRLPAFR